MLSGTYQLPSQQFQAKIVMYHFMLCQYTFNNIAERQGIFNNTTIIL